ncbi:DUF934 domain-containing protein [Afifella pfennigii]|uniref:DUF934 domain-containing protein n=1 Tax=Afifella pfennigii TaxID=209897 RepID=UPI00068B00B0|nr:DUF934 domain-containing protein [Afifella pfennigii]
MSETLRLWRPTGFAEDAWRLLREDETPPEGASAIVPAARFAKAVDDGGPAAKAVWLQAGESLEAVLPHLAALELVALDFPRFSDGRSFSKAQILRGQYGFAGEMRAIGDVILDQIPLMLRCGFDAFQIRHLPTIAALERGELPAIHLYYQPASGEEAPAAGRAWARRPAIPRPQAAGELAS